MKPYSLTCLLKIPPSVQTQLFEKEHLCNYHLMSLRYLSLSTLFFNNALVYIMLPARPEEGTFYCLQSQLSMTKQINLTSNLTSVSKDIST